jgi:hypothetical protein
MEQLPLGPFRPGQRIRYKHSTGLADWYVGTITGTRPLEDDDGLELIIACEHKRGTHFVSTARCDVEVVA